MPKKPEILSVKTIARTALFHVEGLHLRFSNGEERNFERLKGGRDGSVMMVPMLDADTVLLVREYGVGIEDYFLALPKGLVEPGEDILEAASRELMEEVGYGARRLTCLRSMSLSPSYISGAMPLVLAQDLYEKRLVGDEPEPIEIVPWKLSRLNALLARDDFHEARSIAALFLVRELLKSA